MKTIRRIIGILAFSLMAVASAWAGQPNVIFILADDLGIGGLHCYGTEYLETPHLDRLRSEGMKFSNGLAAYPTCKPSRAALLTGQYGPRTGVYRVKDNYGQEEKARWVIPDNGVVEPTKFTLGQAFKKAGYATAMYGKWHVSNHNQTHPNPHYGYDEAFVSSGAHYNAVSIPPVDLPKDTMIEKIFTDQAMGFMEKSVAAEKPFFIYMPYFLVHGPAEARADYIQHFEEKLKDVDLEEIGDKSHATVAAMTKMLDEYCGQLIDKVNELGIDEDTIILFTSDNGSYDANLTGGYRGTKGDTYDGGLRVPYLFKWKGNIQPNSVSEERIIGVDVYPTLLGLAGIDKPMDHVLDGVDLTPLLTGKVEQLASRNVYCFYPKYVRYSDKDQHWALSWRNVIYGGDYKLIEYPEYDEYELFNLATDRNEETNLASAEPERLENQKRTLHRWLKKVDAPPLTPNPDYAPAP
jgi:arylsulfatase A-like enzyme